MNFFTGLENFLRVINDNWTTILVIIGLAIGIYQKIKIYLAKSTDEKIRIAKDQISDIVMDMITEAEAEYGEWSKAGTIKRSRVLAEIYKRYPILTKVANQEELTNWLDAEIDSALKHLKNVIDVNSEEGDDNAER